MASYQLPGVYVIGDGQRGAQLPDAYWYDATSTGALVLTIDGVTHAGITSGGATAQVAITRSGPTPVGTLYVAVYPSAVTPTWSSAGGWSGTPAFSTSVAANTLSGTQNVAVSGLSPTTDYKTWAAWSDGTNDVGPVGSALWTTLALVESISVTNITDKKVFEGAAGSASITISGTHTGLTDTIQVQIETTAGGVVSAWQTLQASVAEGAYSGTITVPRGGWYYARVRKAGNTGITAIQTQKWGVGFVLVVTGQSHVSNWRPGTDVAANDRAVNHDGTNWIAQTGTGELSLSNAIITTADCPVAVITEGNPGAPLSGWWNGTTKQTYYNNWQAKITAMGGGLSAFVWWQGEGNLGNSKETYRSGVASMFAQIRADYSSTLPIVVMALGRNTAGSTTDENQEAIRDAHIDLGNDANTYCISTLDFPLSGDGLHFAIPASSFTASARMAQVVLASHGLGSYSRGPVISSASISGTLVDVTLTHGGGTDFTPATGVTGFQVLDNGTPVTISGAVRQAANKIRITLSSAPTGPVTLRYGYGMAPDISGLVKDNTTLALPMETTDADVSVIQIKRVLLNCIQRVGGSAAASVTGLRWAFFDQSAPNVLTAPVVTGTGESTDASGVLEIDVTGTSLNVGDTGYLVTDTAAGVGFAGPVVVSG